MEKKSTRVIWFQSMKLKIVIVVAAAVLIVSGINLWTVIPLVSQHVTALIQNYMLDMVWAYGDTLESMELLNKEEALNAANLERTLNGVYLEGMDSSYAYLVSGDGTMLYHPTASKIGAPVENEVIKKVVSNLKSGVIPEPAVTAYDYNGAKKFASYYVAGDGSFVLVMSADEEEALDTVSVLIDKTVKGSIFGLVLVAVLAMIAIHFMIAPLKKITAVAARIADLDFTADKKEARLNGRKDETGAMSRAITNLREELSQVISQIRNQSGFLLEASELLDKSAGETASAISNVENSIQDIAQGVSAQAGDTQKATDNIILMGDMMSENREEVQQLHRMAAEMKSAGNEASKTLAKLGKVNEEAIGSIDIIYEQTHTTNESALKIQQSASLITDIAEETNLLSLNASIEAARAGEQGRGFAVVADQIQKLAEQSNEAAKQIQSIIEELLLDSGRAVETMGQVKEIMGTQSHAVINAGEMFGRVKEGIDDTLTAVDNISGRTEQMEQARENVVNVVENLTGIAEENAAGSEEASASITEIAGIVYKISGDADKLKEIANVLEDNMKEFKL